MRKSPVIVLLNVFFLASAFGQVCDLPSPNHPDPIEEVELSEGMIYRYVYNSFVEVDDGFDVFASGFKASRISPSGASYTLRRYKGLTGRTNAFESEALIDPRDTQKSARRVLFCGNGKGSPPSPGIIEIEVTSGTVTFLELFAIEVYDGVLYYSLFDPSLLSIESEPLLTELTSQGLSLSVPRSTLGRRYAIEKSLDLRTWIRVPESEYLSQGGSLNWLFDLAPTEPSFYRVAELD